ncbi:zincin [Cylindrobasidium torrendii FP15055 ss-10]|uniref:deuterolysin n=1 Tax=Cylindrobasidium torrendii FP15055 ss-10 TaxID=1314674 RepID=A0A0D7BLM8_9AGAR|nr:zincin [Cylindrobasidium torrendii FP15055 ss-10]
MFAFSALVSASLAAIALASPAKRFDGLNVEVTAPSSSVSSIKDLEFTAVITNNNSDDVKVLKYGTILDSLPTRSFTVTKDGAEVPFTGVKVSAQLNDAAYATIPAGESVTVSHKVADIYDFASAGTGKFSFTPKTELNVGDSAASASDLAKVSVSSQAIEVEVTSDVAKRAYKRATPTCSDSSQLSFIDASYTEAKELASISSDYVSSNGASDSLFSSYFSSNSVSSVTGILDAVSGENDSSRTLSCVDEYDVCDGNVIAYTLIATTDIYFCDIFFDEVDTPSLCTGTTVASRNIRGGTTLHELTHAVADTDDVTYGCAADQALSASQQISNADNFNCFTTQVYADTQC